MMELVLDIGDVFPLGELWDSTLGFILIFTAVVGAIGLGSRSLAVASYGAFLTFAYFAITVDNALLTTLLYAVLTLVVVGSAFKVWRLEGFEVGS